MKFAAALILVVLIGPLFAPYDPTATNATAQLQPPSATHPLGTDLLGRDVLSRVLHGGQRTLLIAVGAAVVGFVPGMVLGLIGAGRGPGVWFIDAVINALLAFPGLLLAFVLLALLGRGAAALMLAVGVTQIAACARITQSAARGVLNTDYVLAARSSGAGQGYILSAHVLTNIRPLLLSYAAVIFSYALLNNAALSFLGFGGEPSIPDWGVMLYEARASFRAAPWIGVLPGFGLTALVGAVNRAFAPHRRG